MVNFDGAANPSDNIQLIHKPYQKSAPQNPIMVVSVDEGVMRDHHDIFNDKLCSFLSELIISKTQK